MELEPHDILHINSDRLIACCPSQPGWMSQSLTRAPFVVVRRAEWQSGQIPVGIRGFRRNERIAAFLSPVDVIERITPCQIALGRVWRDNPRSKQIQALAALDRVEAFFGSMGILWGPAGSVGFELASGLETAVPASDLDLTIRANLPLSVQEVRTWPGLQKHVQVRLDIQIETPHGAVSLLEYARGERQVLLRTRIGPMIVANPWNPVDE